MNTNYENSWRMPVFRNNVVRKIEEAIQKSGMPTMKSSTEMENHVYREAKNKDEYLSYVAKLILHVRTMNSNKKAQMSGQQMQSSTQPIQDPMIASIARFHVGAGNQNMMDMISQQGDPQLSATSCAEAKKEWKNLRNRYRKAKKCITKRSGSGRSDEKIWKYYDMMRFTEEYTEDDWKTISNSPTIPSTSDYTDDTEDELRDFCNSLYQSLKKLPRLSQLKLKRELMETITKVEEEVEHSQYISKA